MNEAQSNPNMEQKCPQCGAPLPSGVLAGMCPACLLKQGAAADTGVAPESAPFTPPSVEEVARLFPQLEIQGLIGKGGMGAVYKARQPALDRLVALKILPPQTAAGPGFVERFNREARALARLNHPNIVGVHEFGQANGLSYFIMEFVDGVNLREMERAGKLTPREALQIVPQICEALQFAHDEGIVHRDIKPENILLDKRGRVKIADFGIAKILGGGTEPELTQTQSVVGTPHYMAPEQMEKPTAVDHRADIFSLGVVFYEMLTGELPLGKFGPPSSRKIEVDVRLDDVVLRTLERDPELRYQHASQVKTAVDTIVGSAAPPPRAAIASGPAMAEEILAKDYKLGIRDCVRRAWKLLRTEFWPFVGITALFMALLSFAGMFGGMTIMRRMGNDDVTAVGSAVTMLVWGPLIGGLFYYFLKKIRREATTVETAFGGFSHRFLHLFLAGFVTTLLTWLGYFLILPGIYLTVAWMFTLPLVIDKQLDFWSAMELSRKVVTRHWFKCFGLCLALLLLTMAGVFALVVGLFVMIPLIVAAQMYAYEDIFGGVTGTAPAAAATGPTGTIVMPTAAPARGQVWNLPAKIGVAAVGVVIVFALLLAAARQMQARATSATTAPEETSMAVPSAPALPPPPAEPPQAGFAAVADLDLTNGSAINLSTGEQKPLPAYLAEQLTGNAKDMAIVAWMEGADMDFAYVNGAGYTMLAGFATMKRDDWEQFDPNKLSAALQKTGRDMGNKLEGTGMNSPTNMSYGFQTRSGKLGLLQLVEIHRPESSVATSQAGEGTVTQVVAPAADDPNSVTIRYKLIEVAGVGSDTDENVSLRALADRLDAATGITDSSQRNEPLAKLAVDAARVGQPQIASRAISHILDIDQRDAASREAALELAKRGMRKAAVDMAKGISDLTARDETLSQLAK